MRLSSFDGSKFVIIFVTYLIRTQTPPFHINQSFLIIMPLHADHFNRDQIIAVATAIISTAGPNHADFHHFQKERVFLLIKYRFK